MSAWARAAALALALASSGAAGEPRLQRWTGGPTPALAGTDLAGQPFRLRALRGRVVLVHFWASWCEPCVDELPSLVKLRERLRDRPLDVVMVNFGEGKPRVERFVREHGVEPPVLLDRDRRLAVGWGVGELPMSFLVDADGRVRYAAFGECDWNEGKPAAALERLLREAERASPGGQRAAR